MQGDILSTYFLSHGDAQHVLLIPGSVEECYSLAMEAFDLAEQFQTPVFVMTRPRPRHEQLDGGPVPLSRRSRSTAGKVLRRRKSSRRHVARFKEFARYRDVDGDGIPYRTLPGLIDTRSPPISRAGPGTRSAATYSETPEDYKANMDRLARKFETARALVPKPVVSQRNGLARRHDRLRLLATSRVEEAAASC